MGYTTGGAYAALNKHLTAMNICIGFASVVMVNT